MLRDDFSFGEIGLVTLDGAVYAPSGIVYSTAPQRSEGDDGHSYFIKGPEAEVVFAELAGCVLANAVGLTVPAVRAGHSGGEVYAGSRAVNGMRDISPWLSMPRSVSNYDELFAVIVVDTWLGNNDRNMGNIIGASFHGGLLEFVCIDFEKSKVLRPHPRIQSALLMGRDLWPTGELGVILRGIKPLRPPQAFIDRIGTITDQRLIELLHPVCDAVPGMDWLDDTVHVLQKRANEIAHLLEEVWK